MRSRSVVVCLLSLLLLAIRSQAPVAALAADAPAASELPSLEALENLVKAASGTRPDNELIVVNQHRNGNDGSITEYRFGSAFREIDVLGSFTEQTGVVQHTSWHTNDNGEFVPEARDPGLAADDTYSTKLTRVAAPFDAYVISSLNSRGAGERRFIDPITHRVVRLERIYPAQTIVTTYDDFRTTDGYTRAWHWTTDDGAAADAGDYHVTKLEVGSVQPSDVEKPQSRRLVTFPAGAHTVELPVTMHDGKFIVRVMIGGRGLDFVLDTGSAGIVIDDDVAKSLGLHIEDRARNSANAGTYTSSRAIVPRMDIGSLSMTNVAVSTSPHLDVQSPGLFKAVGLLGFDFISNMELVLDYEGQKVVAFAPDFMADVDDPKRFIVPIRIGSEVPQIDVTVNGALGERFIVDTGAADIGLTVFDYFARRYPDAVRDAGGANPRLQLSGVGGALQYGTFRAKTIKIANVVFDDFGAYRIFGKAYGGNDDGLIGPSFLRFFTVYLDYGSEQMVLVPNALGRAAMGIK